MKKIYAFLVVIVLHFSSPLHAAESDNKSDSSDFIENSGILIRQGVADNNIEKPALFQMAWPGSGSDNPSYSLDIGLTTKEHLFSTVHGYFSPTVEYHRHTEISRPQDNFQAGLLGVQIVGDL